MLCLGGCSWRKPSKSRRNLIQVAMSVSMTTAPAGICHVQSLCVKSNRDITLTTTSEESRACQRQLRIQINPKIIIWGNWPTFSQEISMERNLHEKKQGKHERGKILGKYQSHKKGSSRS